MSEWRSIRKGVRLGLLDEPSLWMLYSQGYRKMVAFFIDRSVASLGADYIAIRTYLKFLHRKGIRE